MTLGLSSCSSLVKTSKSVDVNTPVETLTGADLVVSPKKITYTYKTSKAERRAGKKNVLSAAVAAALAQNGGGDVLVSPQYEYKSNMKQVTVTGYPATYKNFKAK